MEKVSGKNFFQTKKELCLRIFEEIVLKLNVDMETFLNESFVDRKKLLLKGNKKIPLYNLSSIFSSSITDYLNRVFVLHYQ